jgi:dihydroorotase
MTDRLTIRKPDDWHLHVRDNEMLAATLPWTARHFGRAILMPNLIPPVRTTADAIAYRERAMRVLPKRSTFKPLMTCYLTDDTDPDDVERGFREGVFTGVKLYPANATTNSAAGVTDYAKIRPVLARMEKIGMRFLMHGEVTDPEVDIFDREAVFMETKLKPLRRDFPELKIVVEHMTTKEAVQYVRDSDRFTAGTITAHHLLYNRNALFTGGIRPHYYCLPVLKREVHRQALVEAATSGSPKFFLGTDSAPHPALLKEHALGCAGCYTALSAMELYAEAFDSVGAIDKLEGFASFFGADFYGLPRNSGKLTLKKEAWQLPEKVPLGETELMPLRGGEQLPWRVVA